MKILARPFCYRDFLKFRVDNADFTMRPGTFRNKILELKRSGVVERYFLSVRGYYVLKGSGYLKPKISHSPSGVPSKQPVSSASYEDLSDIKNNKLNQNIRQTLLGYVLPLLPTSSLYIHNLHLHLKISSEIYHLISTAKIQDKNSGKQYSTMIWKAKVIYTFYPKGTVNIEVKCSDRPFRIETSDDYNDLLLFFNSLRETLFKFLRDIQDIRIAVVSLVEDWYLTEYDINKDIKLDDQSLHIAAVKIQIKYHLHLFRIYIKSIGKNKFCRIEENRKQKNKNPIEVINEIFSPFEKIEKEIVQNSHILSGLQKRLQMVGDSDLL